MGFRIRTILAATDLSDASSHVVRGASTLATLTGAALHLVHVREPSGEFVAEQRRIYNARRDLDAHLRGVLPEPGQVRTAHVAFGRPAAAILERAEQIAADLIVVGPHRTRPLGDRILGTTADRIVRTASVPCLIVRRPLSMPVRRVLVPSDLSAAARGALTEALTWAGALGLPVTNGRCTEIKVLHVAEEPANIGLFISRRGEIEAGLGKQVRDALRLTGEGKVRVRKQVVFGDSPSEAVLQVAREDCTDLLVMGTHGDSTLVRALLGSVSSAVARDADAPVLLVPPSLWRSRGVEEEAVATPLPSPA